MTTPQHYGGRLHAGYSGNVRDNIAAVQGDAYSVAKQRVFTQISEMLDTAWCSVDGLTLTKSPHGIVREFRGNYTLIMVPGSFHAHTDHDWKGDFKNWQGSADYDFDFEVDEHAV